ncbi:MAG TPA: EAL domain-containing response regulator [Candidatus Competibacteraceae bacterium]|nr:EAL domain-containing response regulator [Candidatus Competibacteraceae bacterium]
MHVPHLLVLDDDAATAELVAILAEQAGYSAQAATDFATFCRRFDECVELVVLDLLMPDVDGVEVLRYLAKHGCQAGILLISAFDQRVLKSATQLAQEHGLQVVGGLAKPFDHDELIRMLIRKRQSQPQSAGADDQHPALEELRRALDQEELVPFYQPLVEMRSARLTEVEALLRWQHPQRGLLGPELFISTAENSDLLDRMTEQTITKALGQVVEWRSSGLEPKLAINVSMRSLNQLDFPERLLRLAGSLNVPTQNIIIEITESWLAENLVVALDILSRLRLKGFALSIDDYGTGYSTMEQLKRMPFSQLKLDRFFVRGAGSDPVARVIVESTITMAHRLGMRVVAEGVESREDWDCLAELGCDLAQGFYIAPPMPGAELADWLRHWRNGDRIEP